jgi:hypothetical protein
VPYVRCAFLFHPVHSRWSVRRPRRPTAERLLAEYDQAWGIARGEAAG